MEYFHEIIRIRRSEQLKESFHEIIIRIRMSQQLKESFHEIIIRIRMSQQLKESFHEIISVSESNNLILRMLISGVNKCTNNSRFV